MIMIDEDVITETIRGVMARTIKATELPIEEAKEEMVQIAVWGTRHLRGTI